jgi:hypothetical protein
MQATIPARLFRNLTFLLLAVSLGACSWEGDGPTRIPGTPAPPPPEIPPGFCDVINFEDACGPFTFLDFAGGVAQVVDNPDKRGANTTDKVGRMWKFAGEVFGGSTLVLDDGIDFSEGQAFTMKVWSPRAVPVLFKFEGLDQERSASHSGSGAWEEVCFDFRGSTTGPDVTGLTLIFDLGVMGNANSDLANWTFFFDEITQVADCGGTGAPTVLPVDFEGAGPYVFNDFEGGVGSVIANPVSGGINTSANVARMQKFAGETFAGSTLALSGPVDFAAGQAFTMKVWSPRAVPVLFKFEGLDQERSLSHGGGSAWEELCFDFTGSTTGPATSAITFIFDLGVAGNAGADPANWTFYFDDITQVANCPGTGAPTVLPVNFEGAGPYVFDDFEGGVGSVIPNPVSGGINTSAQVARMQKFPGAVFAGSTLALGGNIDFSAGPAFTVKVWSPRAVPVLFKLEGLDQERSVSHSGGSEWQELCFDFTGSTAGAPSSAITFIFDLGVAGNAEADPTNWTFYFDDITQVAGCAAAPPGDPVGIDFDGPGPFNFLDFEGGVATVIANPDPSGINTSAQVARMQKFAGAVFGGSTLPLASAVDFSAGPAFTVKVWSARPVPVLFKLEGLNQERSATHSGGSTWQELCFDFSGSTVGAPATGITFIFDLGVAGDAENDPDNWTFYFDDIEQVSGCGAPPPPPVGNFPTITFDDPALTYTLTDFGGNASVVLNDPVGGSNQVVQVVKTAGAELWAGTTVSTLPDQAVPVIPFTASETRMTVRVYSPDVGIPVRLKVENAADDTVSVETEATTTVANGWETLTFDFSAQAPGTAALNLSSTYNKLSIFFNFGTTGATAGEKIYFFDDIAFGDDAGGGGVGIIPEAVVYATDPNVIEDLAPPGIDNFGSGATFNAAFALDADFNPAFEVSSGEGYGGGVHVGFVAFTGYPAGFAAGFGTVEFKVKVNAPGSATAFEVKFIGGGDTSRTYDLATYPGSTVLGNGWYQVQIPMSDFVSNIAANDGFLLGPLGAQAGAFTMLLTDIGFSGTAGGGGDANCDPVGGELATNGDFEAGDLSCWEAITNGGSITVVNTENNTPGGTWAARVVAGAGNNPTLKQNFLAAGTVAIGDIVDVSFDMKGSAGDGGVIFPKLISEGATGSDGPILQTIAAPTPGWTTYTYSPTITADVTRGITFEISVVCGAVPGCNANVFIDNVSVRIR